MGEVRTNPENAIDHLANIYEYIGLNSTPYIKRIVDKITRRSTQIADQPYPGRKVPVKRKNA